MGHYKANLRDIEFNLFEALALGPILDSGSVGELDSSTSREILAEVARFDFSPRRPLRHLAAVRDTNRARLAIEFEKYRARAILVRIAGSHVTHDQRLAALQIDIDFLS